MKIHLNGEPREVRAETVSALIEELALPAAATLVEQNGVALRPDEWTRPLANGDRIELLRIVAGG